MKKESDVIKSMLLPSEVIGQKISLKNKGNGQFISLCPFHKEKTPSFSVNDLKGFYHCFGCGAHGDIFSFIMAIEKLTYKESLEKLAAIAGITLKYKKVDTSTESEPPYYEIYEKTGLYYSKQLFGNESKEALDYLRFRKIGKHIIEKYQLGFAPKSSTELENILRKDFEKKDIIDSGILKQKEGRLYNPFFNRIIFPIHNLRGKVVAFGGRVINDEKPKYLNSSENPIFHKSDNLYAYHISKQYIHKEKEILVVEGYLDVLSLASNGVYNVVAPLGANINPSQIQKLWQLHAEPNICFDKDLAGQKATYKIAHEILPFITHNKTIKITALEKGKDPDEIIENYGIKYFKNLIANAHPLCDYIFNSELKLLNPKTPEQKTKLKKYLEMLSGKITDDTLKFHYKSHFNNLLYNYFFRKEKKPRYNKKNNLALKNTPITTKIISIIINYPELLFDKKVYEEFFRVELPSSLDIMRNIVLNVIPYSQENSIVKDLEKTLSEATPDIKTQFRTLKQDRQIYNADEAREVFMRSIDIYSLNIIKEQIKEAKSYLCQSSTEENLTRLKALKEEELNYKDRLKIV